LHLVGDLFELNTEAKYNFFLFLQGFKFCLVK
jgi:hypothetical protein